MKFDSTNPATGEHIDSYELMAPDQVDTILERCRKAQRTWKATRIDERARCMMAAHDVLLSGKEAYARLMSQEMGKLYQQGIAEVEKCAWGCRYYAEHADHILSPEIVATEASKSFVNFLPLGVVLAIMPWNFPFWQVFRFAAPALMAGNGTLLKHAPNVTGCSLAVEQIFVKAGFPEDLFRSLVVDIPQTTRLIHDPGVAAVTVTASVNAGRAVATEAGKALKKCVLELGGSDAFIVLEDADIDRAVEIGIVSRFQNSGQSCIAAKRFIIVDQVYDEFEQKFVAAVQRLKMGNPMLDAVYIGPLARIDLRDALADQVARSVAAGARVLIGGDVPQGPGAYYPPTVLADIREGMPAWSEELFGPVASLIRVANEAEAIDIANATTFGLGGSVWTRDLARGEAIAANRIESGATFVNEMSKSDPRMPFGGIRQSGYGRELSAFGMREFVNVHSVWVDQS